MTPFTLTQDDVDEVTRIACGRIRANRDRPSYKASRTQSDDRIHWVGAFAEVGVRRLEQQPIQCEIYAGPRGLDEVAHGPDIGDWQIKGSELWTRGRLLVPMHLTHKHEPDSRYLLVWVNFKERRGMVVGWRYGHEFLRPEFVDRTLPVPAFAAPWPLRPYGKAKPPWSESE